jgi:hypothetical protein
MVTLGIDAHKRTHTVVAADDDDCDDESGPSGDAALG